MQCYFPCFISHLLSMLSGLNYLSEIKLVEMKKSVIYNRGHRTYNKVLTLDIDSILIFFIVIIFAIAIFPHLIIIAIVHVRGCARKSLLGEFGIALGRSRFSIIIPNRIREMR